MKERENVGFIDIPTQVLQIRLLGKFILRPHKAVGLGNNYKLKREKDALVENDIAAYN